MLMQNRGVSAAVITIITLQEKGTCLYADSAILG